MSKVSEEQLKQARELRAKQQQSQLELGGLYLTEEDIKNRKEELVTSIRETNTSIQDLMKEISKEFGDGELNLESGEFIVKENTEENIG
tara:strand:+ start:1713 stop:1979 length:267 start_codon:yes stop_codon:yes gene_type:complete